MAGFITGRAQSKMKILSWLGWRSQSPVPKSLLPQPVGDRWPQEIITFILLVRGGGEASTESLPLEPQLCKPKVGRAATRPLPKVLWGLCPMLVPGCSPTWPCHHLRTRVTAVAEQGDPWGWGAGAEDPPGEAWRQAKPPVCAPLPIRLHL